MAIFIEWDEEQKEFAGWRPISGIGIEPAFSPKIITRSARYSNDDTPEIRQKAAQWIKSERPNGRVVIK